MELVAVGAAEPSLTPQFYAVGRFSPVYGLSKSKKGINNVLFCRKR